MEMRYLLRQLIKVLETLLRVVNPHAELKNLPPLRKFDQLALILY